MRRLLIFVMALCIPLCLCAQKSARRGARKAKEKTPEEERIDRMTEATQKIMFIDSVIVRKDALLGAYCLSDEAGSIYTSKEFFNDRSASSDAYVHVNGIGNRCYFPLCVGGASTRLYTSDRLGDEWSEPALLAGIFTEGAVDTLGYPFMLSDGATLYFAAKGTESIGGYDIFATRFNSGTGRFMTPENIGMPFNSTDNDYMYAVDEVNGIGWFATDRGQDSGNVCVYVFVPSETHETYDAETYTPEQIAAFAKITSIADTWDDDDELDSARKRLQAMRQTTGEGTEEDELRLVINDNTTYRSYKDFRSKENYYKYKQAQTLKDKLKATEAVLEKERNQYAAASAQQKSAMKADILKDERTCEMLTMQVMTAEKEIRISENELIKAAGK